MFREKSHSEIRFLYVLEEFLHQAIQQFLRPGTKERQPLCLGVSQANVFYGVLLLSVAREEEPSLRQFYGMRFAEGPEHLYQAGLHLFRRWRRMGLSAAVEDYERRMKRIIRVYYEKAETSALAFQNEQIVQKAMSFAAEAKN